MIKHLCDLCGLEVTLGIDTLSKNFSIFSVIRFVNVNITITIADMTYPNHPNNNPELCNTCFSKTVLKCLSKEVKVSILKESLDKL